MQAVPFAGKTGESVAEAVFRELDRTIIGNLLLPDLARVWLRINRNCRDAVRARIAELWPLLAPLLDHHDGPFYLTRLRLLRGHSIQLSRRELGDRGAQELAAAMGIGALSQCEKLSLDGNKIGDAGVIALAQVFKPVSAGGAMSLCQVLKLGWNNIGDAGITAFAKAIKPASKGGSGAMANLKDLYFWFNQIGDAGLSALADACAGGALAQCRVLMFGSNQIGDAGIKSLAKACAMEALPQCTYLNFDSNRIGDAGVTALAQALTPVRYGGSGAMASLEELVVNDPLDDPALEAACRARDIWLS